MQNTLDCSKSSYNINYNFYWKQLTASDYNPACRYHFVQSWKIEKMDKFLLVIHSFQRWICIMISIQLLIFCLFYNDTYCAISC